MDFDELEVSEIVSKLKNLGCTLLEDADNSWIKEIFFKPGIYRYRLIEWIFTKLEFKIPEVPARGDFEDQTFKNLQAAVSNLGICRENSHDVIKGTAPFEDQLVFWKTLVDFLWAKHCLSELSDECKESEILSSVNENNRSQASSFETYSSIISENYKCVPTLFKETMQLFPPDIEELIKNTPFSKNQLNFKSILQSKENFDASRFNKTATSSFFNRTSLTDESLFEPSNEKQNNLEESISAELAELKKCGLGSFNDAYNELKPLISLIQPEEFFDVGPEFENAVKHLDSLLKLKSSLSIIKSSDLNIETMNSELRNLALLQQPLSDAELDNFTSVLKTTLEENNC